MRTMLTAAGVVLALLVVSVAPAIAAGPRWGTGPGAGVATTIPADVHKAIETATQAAAARVLKMTQADLAKERAAGKTLAYLAGAKNVPLQTVQTAVVNARKFAVNQALASGKITKAQADALLQAGPRFGMGNRSGASQQHDDCSQGGQMRDGRGHRSGTGR
ncbi:MAG: hypothetical protein RDU83_10595 [bacterium]|nr:hypothetical protein [bacterium]